MLFVSRCVYFKPLKIDKVIGLKLFVHNSAIKTPNKIR